MKLSIIVPFFNEEENIPYLIQDIESFCSMFPFNVEVFFIDDASTDRSNQIISKLIEGKLHYYLISHEKNYGQAEAWLTGIKNAHGEFLAFLDADNQLSVCDLHLMYDLMIQGYDVIWGYRKNRKDPLLNVLASRIANKLISILFAIKAHDCGCSLKLIRRTCFENFIPVKNFHRYLPILLKNKITREREMVVKHRSRARGKSKYSLIKTFGVIRELYNLKRAGY